MFDIKRELEERGLDQEQYLELLNDCTRKLNKEIDLDWSEISQKYNLGWSGDCLRKACQPALVGSVFVKEFFEENGSSSSDDTFESRKRELEQLKVQYRDERNAWQKQNREYARLNTVLDRLSEEMKDSGVKRYSPTSCSFGYDYSDQRELIVLLSDLHIGKCFNNAFGCYDAEIAKERLDTYLDKIKYLAGMYPITKIRVVSLGDQINGNIHTSIAITNRENVVKQIKAAAELISDFCYSLCWIGIPVELYSVNGNHSRITKNKDDEIRDERLDNLICWIVSQKLSHISNFSYKEDSRLENGISTFEALGNEYIAVHGDLDRNTESSVSSLCFLTKKFPEAIFRGHMHSPSLEMINGVNVIQSGSLDGSGDDYTLSKRLSGYPSQTCVLVNQQGIEGIFNVKLE